MHAHPTLGRGSYRSSLPVWEGHRCRNGNVPDTLHGVYRWGHDLARAIDSRGLAGGDIPAFSRQSECPATVPRAATNDCVALRHGRTARVRSTALCRDVGEPSNSISGEPRWLPGPHAVLLPQPRSRFRDDSGFAAARTVVGAIGVPTAGPFPRQDYGLCDNLVSTDWIEPLPRAMTSMCTVNGVPGGGQVREHRL